MGKLLRILVIFHFALSVAALTMGSLLFLKRELLKARTQALEERLIEIGSYIETAAPSLDPKPTDPSRDTSPCEATILQPEEIQRSEYWTSYKYDLEAMAEPSDMVKIGDHRDQLKTFFEPDVINGGDMRDAATGQKIVKGENTMWALLEDFRNKISAQYDLLNTTREQLTSLRREYIATINDLNSQKEILRTKLVKIVELEAEIVRLNEKIRALEEKIAELESTIAELKVQIADLQRQIGLLQEQLQEKDVEIAELHLTVSNLLHKLEGDDVSGPIQNVDMVEGDKGTVAQVNEKWGFLAVDLSDACMKEMLGEELDAEYDPKGFEMYVERQREGMAPQFVTKIKLKWIDREAKKAIFDIVPGWTQISPKKGDVIYRHRAQNHPIQ